MADPVSLAITVALNAAVMGMTMMQKIEGPRLEDLTVSTADYGTPLVSIYGTKRVECPCIYAEEIREEKDEQKGKSGKYAEYKYFGTWASFVADHEIDNVLRIWLDRKLGYDMTRSRPRSMLGNKFQQHVRIYLGTEDQAPDPRMVATVEDEEGPGRCPAYLGVAYIMFEDMALEKFGNRYPQVSAQPKRGPLSDPFSFDSNDRSLGLISARFTPNFKRLVLVEGSSLNVWDVANRTLVVDTDLPTGILGTIGIKEDGSFYAMGGGLGAQDIWLMGAYGGGTALATGLNSFGGGMEYVGGVICVYPYAGIQEWSAYFDGLEIITVASGFIATHYFEDEDGQAWSVGHVDGESEIGFCTMPAGGSAFVITSPGSGPACAMDNGNGEFVAWQGGKLIRIDKATQTVVDSIDTLGFGGSFDEPQNSFTALRPGDKTIWLLNQEHRADDLSIIRTVDFTDWKVEDVDKAIYDPLNHALICQPQFVSLMTWRFLDRDEPMGFPLGDICADVAQLAGMDASEFDFDELDQIVLGYSWTQGPAKDVIGALLEIFDSDIRPHGFIQEGKKRGQLLIGSAISSAWMVPDGDRPLYRVPMTSETDLPRRVFATFADPSMDEQPNTAVAQRNAASVKTNRETSFDLSTMAISPDDMQPLLERALRRYWVGATKPECSLSPLEMRLEPGDVRMLTLDGDRLRCKLVSERIRANRVIDTRWEVDGETPLELVDWESDNISPLSTVFASPGGFTNGRPQSEVFIPQETKGFVIDTPLFTDAHDQTAPFLYVAAAPEFPGSWLGSGVWVSDSNDADSFVAGWDSFGSSQECVWGVALDALPDTVPDVIDEGSEIEIILPLGSELSSVTTDEMLASQSLNLAVVGNEIIQFRDAELVGTNRYRLSGLVRGARGTEYAIAGHASAERFVFVTNMVKKHIMGAGEIGDTDYYKFSSLGEDIDSVETIEVEYQANSHRPLSPVHLVLQPQTNGDWEIDWIRRTRVGGSTVNGQDVPLGETSESYKVRILDGATVKRTIETVTNSATYTQAQQVTDWGGAQPALNVEIVQMSPALSLEGFAAGASA